MVEPWPWEALDVDDSDLPSLLRPCNNRRRHTNTNTNTSSNNSTLQPFSLLSPSLSHSQSQSQPTLQTLPSQTLVSDRSHSQPSPRQFDAAAAPSHRLIPGPAGAVQAAMLRKSRDDWNFSCGGDDPPVSTQEYIRRAVEDGNEDDDDDFKRNPWLCALDYIAQIGGVDGVITGTPLSSIKTLNIGRVDLVVGVVKSCTPNGLGELMVTLKDPTGTIRGSVHRKVLTESEFGKDITAGSVMIIKKVAVFTPTRSAYYLNITLRNVVKVICKDSGPPLELSRSASAVKHTLPGIESEIQGEKGMLQKAISLEPSRDEDMNIENIGYANILGKWHNDKQMEKGNPFSGSSQCSSISRNQNAAFEKESLWASKNATEEIIRNTVRKEIAVNEPGPLKDMDNCRSGGQSSSSTQPGGGDTLNLLDNQNDQEIGRMNVVQQQRQTASLPQWTDEQLNELFAFDCEDDGSLF